MPPHSSSPSESAETEIHSTASQKISPVGQSSPVKKSNPENPLIPISIAACVGISLYLCDTVFAGFIQNWRFVAREGLHNPWFPTIAVAIYLLMVYFLPKYMKDRPAQNLQGTMFVHNYFLSYLSLLMLVAILREITVFARKGGFESLACDSAQEHNDSPLYFWYYVFYLSKVYEFIDTLILCVRKKKLIFLHVYHHIITLWLCWVCLDANLNIQWLCTVANALVHVFMYYFYACQSLNINIWWKKYLTSLQILQFVLDECGNVSWAYFVVIEQRQCSGTWTGFWFGMTVIASFLVLFINFFKKTYGSKLD